MERENHNDAVFFVGPEVESTPASGMKTLFVVGVRNVAHVIKYAEEHNCKHVYLGANMSFQRNKLWGGMIEDLLAADYKVTFDYPVDAHEWVLETFGPKINNHRNFIPMISCKIAEVETLNPNTSVKIDDVDFEGKNSGVWVMPVHELLDSNRFTGWNEYGHDEVVARDDDIKALKRKFRAESSDSDE